MCDKCQSLLKFIIFAILSFLFDLLLGKFYILCVSEIWLYFDMIGITGSIAVVVTPLISLMIDQREKFLQKGLRVEFVGKAHENDDAV